MPGSIKKTPAVIMPERRFPPPWTVEDLDSCFVAKDSSGQKLACVYFEDEPGRRSAAKMLSKDEARRIAVNFAKAAGIVAEVIKIKSGAGVPHGKTRRAALPGDQHSQRELASPYNLHEPP